MKINLKTITIFIVGFPYVFRNVVINAIFSPIDSLKRGRTNRINADFLSLHNGRNFFIYKNKLTAEKFIEIEIEPALPKDIIFVNLNENSENTKFAQLTEILENELNFPVVIKIRGAKLLKKNMYDDFYRSMFIDKSTQEIIAKLNSFYDN